MTYAESVCDSVVTTNVKCAWVSFTNTCVYCVVKIFYQNWNVSYFSVRYIQVVWFVCYMVLRTGGWKCLGVVVQLECIVWQAGEWIPWCNTSCLGHRFWSLSSRSHWPRCCRPLRSVRWSAGRQWSVWLHGEDLGPWVRDMSADSVWPH